MIDVGQPGFPQQPTCVGSGQVLHPGDRPEGTGVPSQECVPGRLCSAVLGSCFRVLLTVLTILDIFLRTLPDCGGGLDFSEENPTVHDLEGILSDRGARKGHIILQEAPTSSVTKASEVHRVKGWV